MVVEGTLKPDGTLELDQKPNLAPGRAQVIVHALPELPDGDPFWDMLRSIWGEQKAPGHVPRSVEEVEAERREMREGWARRQEARAPAAGPLPGAGNSTVRGRPLRAPGRSGRPRGGGQYVLQTVVRPAVLRPHPTAAGRG